jgi:pimeloyl-ACP methyl ester carboxylesterase
LKGFVVPVNLMLLALLLVSPPSIDPKPVVSPLEFRASFKQALAGKLSIPTDVKRAAEAYRYVFVAGFMSEGMSEYFTQNARELAAMGVPRKAIHFIYPSSGETIEGNAAAVRSKFREFAALGAEKLVVIAHSRGACDTLAFALENPEFVADHVEALFLVQGPFGGSGVADYLTGEGPPIDRSMPLRDRLIAQGVGRLEEFRLSRGQHRGLPALTRQASKEYWEKALDKHRAAIPVVSPKTLYITTKKNSAQLRLVLRATASYLDAHFGPNDGMVVVEDQSVAGVGTVLAVLDAGHTDLTHSFPSAVPKRRLRRALIDAIIMGIGLPRPNHEPPAQSDTTKSDY